MTRAIPKKALIRDIAEVSGKSQKECNAFLASIAEAITNRLKAGDTVVLPGLGKFEPRERPARQVKTPAGDIIDKAAHRTVVIKAVREIKEAVNE